ncbi:MAG: zinc ribbon domain-containing protein [Planctomycetota bacterium]|nr:MAG: zinc ribbon domain-containing protein [Planctomycetota bacterium]
MPIYEFYCADCHTIYNFLASGFATERRPSCPRCERPELERRISVFSISKNRPEPGSEGDEDGPEGLDDLPPGFDEDKLMRVMSSLERELDGIDEDDPRQMAHLMRRVYDATGMPLGPGMQEAIRRMEAGEDPEAIEEELGDVLESESESIFGDGGDAGGATGGGTLRGATLGVRERLDRIRRQLPPRVDPKLYRL